MKKIKIEFNTPKSKKSDLYKLLSEKISDEVLTFYGYLDQNNVPQGECAMALVDDYGQNLVFQANFSNGNLIGSGLLSQYDEETNSLEFELRFNFMSETFGEIKYSDGTVYIGNLFKTYPDGKGKTIEKSGDINIGFFKEGVPHGLFLHYDKNNELVYKSVYLDGDCIVSSDKDEEILKALSDCGFNYKNLLKSYAKKISKTKEDKFSVSNIKKGLDKIEKNIIGQKNAVKLINNNLLLSLMCARMDDKPITSMVFTGPTGVGKTEMAKQISENIFNKKPFTVDFANFHDDFMLSSLIGSPDGYIGSNKEPEFLKYIRENSETGGVLLFEEIDKADPDCLNFFMRILDEGEVIDSHNKPYSVKNFVILATTNMSANTTRKLGFSDRDDDVKMQMANTEFTGMKKEQIARFGLVVEFSGFNNEEKRILTLRALDKAVKRIKTIKGYNIEVKYEKKFIDSLVSKINATFGVRDIQARVSSTVNEKLAEFIRKNEATNIIVNFKDLDNVKIKENKKTEEKTF